MVKELWLCPHKRTFMYSVEHKYDYNAFSKKNEKRPSQIKVQVKAFEFSMARTLRKSLARTIWEAVLIYGCKVTILLSSKAEWEPPMVEGPNQSTLSPWWSFEARSNDHTCSDICVELLNVRLKKKLRFLNAYQNIENLFYFNPSSWSSQYPTSQLKYDSPIVFLIMCLW